MGLGPTEDQRLGLGHMGDLLMGLGPTEDQGWDSALGRSNDRNRPYGRSKVGTWSRGRSNDGTRPNGRSK
ncbi:hypothetical protein CRG98_049071, partial [Punica granatum]